MSESLREQLAANLDKIVTVPEAQEEPAAPAAEPAPTPSGGEGEAPASKIAEAPTSDRARDPDTGQFVKEPKAKAPAAQVKPTPAAPPPAAPASAAAGAPKPVPQRPSSWKKDYWGHWDKMTTGQALTPEEQLALANYMQTRETDFQHGVATYKREWENARPLLDAMQQFMPTLQQYGIEPRAWITNLGNAHRTLALGSPQQKLAGFMKLAQDYGIPLEALVDQTAQSQYLQSAPAQQIQQPSGLTREQAEQLFNEQFLSIRSKEEIERFSQETEKYPYFEELRQSMAQLLEAGLAKDLQSAYGAALRLPQHSDIWDAIQEQERARNEEAKRQAEAARVATAKGKAVSVRSATPTAPSDGEKPKDRRSQISAAYDEHVAGGRL